MPNLKNAKNALTKNDKFKNKKNFRKNIFQKKLSLVGWRQKYLIFEILNMTYFIEDAARRRSELFFNFTGLILKV